MTTPTLRGRLSRRAAACTLALLPWAASAEPPTPLIVQADMLPVQGEAGAPACALFLSASDVSGSFLAVALRWSRPAEGELGLRVRLSPGQIDWLSGVETPGFIEEGWLKLGKLDLRSALVAEDGNAPEVYSARLDGPDLARQAYEALLSGPVEILYTTEPGAAPRVFDLGQPLDQDVRGRAEACMSGLLAAGSATP